MTTELRDAAAMEIKGLTRKFGKMVAVDDISLMIGQGQLVSLLGPSGCGKTTTLRLIAGFVTPDAGTIRVGEKILSSAAYTVPPERRNMSMIFQSYALWPHMTVAGNVAYGLRLRHISRSEIRARVTDILGLTQLSALADRYPYELSGGQQQRAALARALVVEPTILLLDEPLSNLDTNLREEMREEIRRLQQRMQITTVYVTHDQIEAMSSADLIVVMNQGRIEQVGSPDDIYERPRSQFVARFVGGTNIMLGRRTTDAVDCDGILLRCANDSCGTAGEVAVSIRPHRIELHLDAGSVSGPNRSVGLIEKHTYLGSGREYVVRLEQGQRLKVSAPVHVEAPIGAKVGLMFPQDACRALPA